MSATLEQMETACDDCGTDTLSTEPGVPTEYYMVHDRVWQAAGMPTRPPSGAAGTGLLCIGCLEHRLGRRLHRRDFTGAPISNTTVKPALRYAWSYRSDRLRARLTAPAPEDGTQLTLWKAAS
jgi:hypothetical protein